MSHIQYTLLRSGTHYYNRRVPKSAVHLYGHFIRTALSNRAEEAAELAVRVTKSLDASWANPDRVFKVDVEAIIASAKPRCASLSEFTDEYLSLKSVEQKPILLAVETFIGLLGDRPVEDYSREDVKAFAAHLLRKGNKTATVRRRLVCISAILNYAFAELELEKRNPASRILIKGEGRDTSHRGTFTLDQLRQGYEEAISSGSDVRLLMPLLGETGCRLGEIVGLRTCDVDLNEEVIFIRPHQFRRLKTAGSERTLPLVGYALDAMELALRKADHGFLFPRYLGDQGVKTTHASNAVNVWLKKQFNGLTAHSLRHTMRDRLRAVMTPLEMIDQIGGWSSINSIGASYGQGYSVDMVREWMEKVKVE